MATLRAAKAVRGAGIVGVGTYRPSRVVHNDEVGARVGRDADWILRRTGIVERRYAAPDESMADMAVEAVTKASADAGIAPRELDGLIVTSMSNTRQSPGAAPEVAHRVGAGCGAFDLNAACAGFCYALGVAASMVGSGNVDHVAVVGSERMTDIIDPTDPGTAPLFADGAGAMIVGPRDTPEIGPVTWGSDGSHKDLIAHTATWTEYRDAVDTPWPTMGMAGPEVFRWVLSRIPDAAHDALDGAGLTTGELDVFVPHQANLRIVDGLATKLRLPESVTVARDVVRAGNTSTASIPLAVDALRERGDGRRAGHALLIGFGGGLTWAGQVVRLP